MSHEEKLKSEFYNQYVTKNKEIKKNITQPKIGDFRRFYIKALEEFNIKDEVFDLYSYIKTR